MNLQKCFRFWLTTSAFWVLFSLILGSKRWVFPYPFHEAWEKQQFILQQSWNQK